MPLYSELYGGRAYAPKTYQNELSERFARVRARHGLDRVTAYSRRLAQPRNEQLQLAV